MLEVTPVPAAVMWQRTAQAGPTGPGLSMCSGHLGPPTRQQDDWETPGISTPGQLRASHCALQAGAGTQGGPSQRDRWPVQRAAEIQNSHINQQRIPPTNTGAHPKCQPGPSAQRKRSPATRGVLASHKKEGRPGTCHRWHRRAWNHGAQ